MPNDWRSRLRQAMAVAGNVGAQVFRLHGAFDPRARWHSVYSPKERRIARVLTRRGIAWQPGPTLTWQGRHYRADLCLPGRAVVLEVLSSGEFEKDTEERLSVFRNNGFRTEIVRDAPGLRALLDEGLE